MSSVKAWAEKVSIPTYELGKAEKNPVFLENRVYQGSSGKVYPHSVTETVSDEKTLHEYQAVYLENEYISVMFLPELGGRVQRATDKTNGYDFVYYNHVIKPAMVGLTGPWISGGIEFNWPQHHRPSTFDPVNWRIEENADGSATVFIGETENMFRTRQVSAFTVYPGRAYLEIRTQLYNPTDAPQTFLWWANPAVAVNDDTRSIFPPDVYAVMDHGKRDVSAFPIARGVYYKMDYSRGVDISRYRNIPVPTSYMAFHSDYDFVGNYDDGKEAGLLHVADHHISPGKKQWTWGNGEFGRAWDRNLTDSDGPYIELMTGCFTDNQPDFTWLMPYEEKEFTQYFMPYKRLGAVSNATKDAVTRISWENGHASIAVYATARYPGARIEVCSGGKVILDKQFDLSPNDVFETELDSTSSDISLRAVSADGHTLVDCHYAEHTEGDLPDPASEIGPAEEIATNEELFLYGQHIEQYRHATRDPGDYYREGLRRDPTDARINNAYGKLLMKRGLIEESIPYFEAAIRKLTCKNPNPYDGEPLFNKGTALSFMGRYDEAYDCFYKATWNAAWQDAGFYRLAAIDMMRGDFERALEHINRSLVRNAHNMKARGAKSAILRKLGCTDEALNFAKESMEIDPLDSLSRREAELAGGGEYGWDSVPGLNHNEIIEYALTYAEWGMTDDATAVLTAWINRASAPDKAYPMLYYHLAHITHDAKAIELAEAAVSDYCFPHRLEDRLALEYAVAHSDNAARAQYYLGCLWYDKRQHERAVQCWESAIAICDDLATAHRNLALAYYNKHHDAARARVEIDRAFAMDETDARVFMERDQLMKKLNVSASERLAEMERHMELTIARDDQYLEYVTCLNALGRYEEALKLILNRHFHPWEGGEGKVPAQWRMALTQLARNAIIENRAQDALDLLKQAAGSYPYSFGEGKLTGAQENDVYYLMGRAYALLGDDSNARECYQRASQGLSEPVGMMYYNDQPPEMIYYQGLARLQLGDTEGAQMRFNKLIDYGRTHMNDEVKIGYFAVSLPDLQIFDDDLNMRNRIHCLFMEALGHLGMDDGEAGKCLDEIKTLAPEHSGVIMHASFK